MTLLGASLQESVICLGGEADVIDADGEILALVMLARLFFQAAPMSDQALGDEEVAIAGWLSFFLHGLDGNVRPESEGLDFALEASGAHTLESSNQKDFATIK